jgi:hypothetical protein
VDPRHVTLVLCLSTAEVLGATPEFVVEVPWWQEAEPLVEAARSAFGLDVRILRILDGPAWYGPPAGGQLTYLAEIDRPPATGSAARLTARTGPDPVLDHPLRQSWARPGGPPKICPGRRKRCRDRGSRCPDGRSRYGHGTCPASGDCPRTPAGSG